MKDLVLPSTSLPASTIPKEAPKLRLVDRILNWIHPVIPEEIALIEQNIATHAEYERLFRAEAERVELENAHLRAQTALIDEANSKERAKQTALINVGLVVFGIMWKAKSIDATVVLKENQYHARDIEIRVTESTGGGIVRSLDTDIVRQFLETQEVFTLYIQPWLAGNIKTKTMSKMPLSELKHLNSNLKKFTITHHFD